MNLCLNLYLNLYLNLCLNLYLNCIGGEWTRVCTIYIGRVLLPSTGKNTPSRRTFTICTQPTTQSTKELFCSGTMHKCLHTIHQMFAQNPPNVCTQSTKLMFAFAREIVFTQQYTTENPKSQLTNSINVQMAKFQVCFSLDKYIQSSV